MQSGPFEIMKNFPGAPDDRHQKITCCWHIVSANKRQIGIRGYLSRNLKVRMSTGQSFLKRGGEEEKYRRRGRGVRDRQKDSDKTRGTQRTTGVPPLFSRQQSDERPRFKQNIDFILCRAYSPVRGNYNAHEFLIIKTFGRGPMYNSTLPPPPSRFLQLFH